MNSTMNKIFITIGLIFCFNLSHANSMLFSSGPFYLPDGIIPPKNNLVVKAVRQIVTLKWVFLG